MNFQTQIATLGLALAMMTTSRGLAGQTLVFESNEKVCVSLQSFDGDDFKNVLLRRAEKCRKLDSAEIFRVSAQEESDTSAQIRVYSTHEKYGLIDDNDLVFATKTFDRRYELSADRTVLESLTKVLTCPKLPPGVELIGGNCSETHYRATFVLKIK